MQELQLIGYWQEIDGSGDYPHPRDFVDLEWEISDKEKIVLYLRSGLLFRGFWGYADCRFGKRKQPQEMGSRELTDGVYLWPEGLAVYVSEYGVTLPHEVVEHMRKSDFTIPQRQQTEKYSVVDTFWRQWTKDWLLSRSK